MQMNQTAPVGEARYANICEWTAIHMDINLVNEEQQK